jgi:hypothetical protein
MRVGLLHLGQSVDFVVSITFLRSPVFAILAIGRVFLLLGVSLHTRKGCLRAASTARSAFRRSAEAACRNRRRRLSLPSPGSSGSPPDWRRVAGFCFGNCTGLITPSASLSVGPGILPGIAQAGRRGRLLRVGIALHVAQPHRARWGRITCLQRRAVGAHQPSTSSLVKITGGLAHLGDFHANHAVAVDANKLHILGRLAVDPLLETASARPSRAICSRLPFGEEHHIRAHAHQHMVVENGLFQLGGSVSVKAWTGVFTSNEISGASSAFTSARSAREHDPSKVR